jgi:hypothetical protein
MLNINIKSAAPLLIQTYSNRPKQDLNIWWDCPFNVLWRLPTPLVFGQPHHGSSTSYSSTIVHCVQALYINHYVCSNKLVLSSPLSCYLLVPNAMADRRAQAQQPHWLPPTQVAQLLPGGLVLRPAGIFTVIAGAVENPPGNCFLLPHGEVFARLGPAAPLQPP